MPEAAADFTAIHFSTSAIQERDRVAMLRDFVGPMVARLEVRPVGDGPLHFEISARALPELAVSTLIFSAVRAERTRALIADGNDNCSFSWLVSPGNTAAQRNRELKPADGEGTLLSMADPFWCATVPGIARGATLSVPRKLLASMVPRLEDRFGTVIADCEALRLLRDYVGVLDQHCLTTPELRRSVVSHVHDLAALALGATRDVAEIATSRGLRAARLHAIKAEIRTCLGEQSLTLSTVALRHGITPRYVQALFEDEGTTFSQFLIGERLELVHRLLRDATQMVRPIGAIAYDAGFGDLSHFNRAFRQRYGATPSDVRAAASRQRGAS